MGVATALFLGAFVFETVEKWGDRVYIGFGLTNNRAVDLYTRECMLRDLSSPTDLAFVVGALAVNWKLTRVGFPRLTDAGFPEYNQIHHFGRPRNIRTFMEQLGLQTWERPEEDQSQLVASTREPSSAGRPGFPVCLSCPPVAAPDVGARRR